MEKNGINRLKREKSPYLLQHANNPVDWYPWSDEAFIKARGENKPIFLSIGYSTCHWCHVMERESFEDKEIAEILNSNFVSIKVDREERPDIDNIYMTVCQMMNQNGGWPLSIFMNSNKDPFFAGTYFPKETRFGRKGFREILLEITEAWKNRKSEITEITDQINDSLKASKHVKSEKGPRTTDLHIAYEHFSSTFDEKNGGFGTAPKFPTPHNLMFLLRYWKRTGEPKALEMVEKTLNSMRNGGIFDHVGYGFHRYSTDRNWLLPHFEKMLYDQALLTNVFLEAYQITKKELYRDTAEKTIEYVLRELHSTEGGFYSAEDADSDGVEGKYYVWTEREIREILGDEEADIFTRAYNCSIDGNYVEEVGRENFGENILHLTKSIEDLTMETRIDSEELEHILDDGREKLFEVRKKRISPYKDDKILTDWNALMISALAKAGKVLSERKYVEYAEMAMEFILRVMKKEDGTLLHRYREGEAGIAGNVDDYSFLISALLELYEATFDLSYLNEALSLQNVLEKHFWDEENYGYFFSPKFNEEILIRNKEIYDGAIPSGNSIAMLNLLKLARFTGNSLFDVQANNLALAFTDRVQQAQAAATQFLCAVDFGIGPAYEVILVSSCKVNLSNLMLKKLYSEFIPNKITLLVDKNEKKEIVDIAPYTKDYHMIGNQLTAYVCKNYICTLPTNNCSEMLKRFYN